ncbi:MAG TPA: TraB/GumN family protein [Candidatus Kapabacteria bacterium]|jgi:hypothetical protein|nr:TraB/GumN family protein [Candidatus Kapabacteria bacterium]
MTFYVAVLVAMLWVAPSSYNSTLSSNAKPEHSLLYRITKAGSPDTSYLFGTFHLLGKEYVDTMRTLMASLHGADLVVGEISMDDLKLSDFTTGMESSVPLDSLMTRKDYALVAKEYRRVMGSPLTNTHVKPLVIYSELLSADSPEKKQSAKASPEMQLPMDIYFQMQAKGSGKKVTGLESPGDQVAMLFDSIPLKEQAAELVDLARHHTKAGTDIETMQEDYLSGNIEGLMDDPELGDLSDREKDIFIYRRNERWLGELREILEQHNAFIAVGAGHLTGEHGLVAGLRNMGYNVNGIPTN